MVFKAEVKGQRLDVFVVEHCSELSRSHVQKLIEQGMVLVDGAQRKANYKLRGTEEVQVSVPEAEPITAAPEDIPLDILYEDKDIIVVNKARGTGVSANNVRLSITFFFMCPPVYSACKSAPG